MRCGGDLTFLLRETLICPLPQELCQDLEGIPVTGHEQSLRAFGGPRGTLAPSTEFRRALRRAGVQRKESRRPWCALSRFITTDNAPRRFSSCETGDPHFSGLLAG